jgi:hypothetical protein
VRTDSRGKGSLRCLERSRSLQHFLLVTQNKSAFLYAQFDLRLLSALIRMRLRQSSITYEKQILNPALARALTFLDSTPVRELTVDTSGPEMSP